MDVMGKSLSQWALQQLCKLADRDPQRADRIVEALWSAHPRLLGELAINAVDHGEVTAEEAATVLGVSKEEVKSRVETFRRSDRPRAPIEDDGAGVAILSEGHVPVWEVCREFRKCNDMAQVAAAFPALTSAELDAAIIYGRENTAEVDRLIVLYEEMQDRKRTEYPFAK